MKANEKIDLDLAEKLRGEGATYKEIGAVFGASRQAVEEKLSYHGRSRRCNTKIIEECPYVGLRRYMIEHPRLKASGLCMRIFSNYSRANLAKTQRMLNGADSMLRVSTMHKLEELTGMPFAELFRRDDHA